MPWPAVRPSCSTSGGTGGRPRGGASTRSRISLPSTRAPGKFYKTVCDLSVARGITSERWKVPVYAMGASIGAGTPPSPLPPTRFLRVYRCIDVGFRSRRRPVYRQCLPVPPLHRPGPCHRTDRTETRLDLSFPQGSNHQLHPGGGLYSRAGDPKEFIVFNGTHGENDEVDARVTGICTSP